jgi:predicted deacylase
MIDGAVTSASKHRAATDRTIVRASRGGLLRLKVAIGDEITAGQEVAEICNLFGEVVERVHSNSAGIAGLIWTHKVVNSGDPIVRYWITRPA